MLHAAVSVAKERKKKEWVEEKCRFAQQKREHWKKNVVWQMLQSKWKDAETAWSLQACRCGYWCIITCFAGPNQARCRAQVETALPSGRIFCSMPGPSDQTFHAAFLAIWGALSEVSSLCGQHLIQAPVMYQGRFAHNRSRARTTQWRTFRSSQLDFLPASDCVLLEHSPILLQSSDDGSH
eukprot:761795-Hanusia_phi.AAC.1